MSESESSENRQCSSFIVAEDSVLVISVLSYFVVDENEAPQPHVERQQVMHQVLYNFMLYLSCVYFSYMIISAF